MKAVLLISGGLDSLLAGKLMIEAGINLLSFHIVTPFSSAFKKESNAQKCAQELGVPIYFFETQEDYLTLVKEPKYGWGKGINPCIDCKIYFLKKAKEYADEVNASFLVTGEVLGQRPKSQHLRALKIIEKDSNLEGLIFRPLSAKVLPPTIPEKEGWINRENMLAISGRSRKKQLQLAFQFGLKSYSTPAGGCLLTDMEFARKAKEAMKYNEWQSDMITLLKLGRHFRLQNGKKLIVGRNEKENELLSIQSLKLNAVTIELVDYPSPVGLLIGNSQILSPLTNEAEFFEKEVLETSIKIVAKYSDISRCKTLPPYCRVKINTGKGFSEIKELKDFEITNEEMEKYKIAKF